MRSDSIFPMERNCYFFGKLMTEREYDAEQSYFNNKRRLINIAVFGAGVVCGLTVTKLDGATLTIESGLALDGLGRELVAEQITIARLDELDGFAGDRGMAPHVYLCAEYAEEPVQPVHAMGVGTGTSQFGRIHETIRLFLRYGEPEPFEISHPDNDGQRAESLEKKLQRGARQQLYLARVHLIRWDEAYEIDRIEQVPFGQYALLAAQAQAAESHAAPPEITHCADAGSRDKAAASAFGTAEIHIPEGAKPGSLHFSSDIPHGLGLVSAAVTLGLCTEKGAVFGDASIFGSNSAPEYAVRVCADSGTFQIGVRLKKKISPRTLNFIWSATAPNTSDETESARMSIAPAVARLKPLEALHLHAEAHGDSAREIIWQVGEPNGGDITGDGVYTAPMDPGVYTVTAQCGGLTASALLVVQ